MSRPWDALPEPRWELVEPRGNGRAATMPPAWDRLAVDPGPIAGNIVGGIEVRLPDALAAEILKWAERIPTAALLQLEPVPHITIRFPITEPSVERIRQLLSEQDEPLTGRLGPIGVFVQPTQDVVYVSVTSPSLRRLHDRLAPLAGPATHPTYVPHVTIAYCGPDEGTPFRGHRTFVGQAFAVESVWVWRPGMAPVELPLLVKRPLVLREPSPPPSPPAAAPVIQIPPPVINIEARGPDLEPFLGKLGELIGAMEVLITRLTKPGVVEKRVERDRTGQIVRVVEQRVAGD